MSNENQIVRATVRMLQMLNERGVLTHTDLYAIAIDFGVNRVDFESAIVAMRNNLVIEQSYTILPKGAKLICQDKTNSSK